MNPANSDDSNVSNSPLPVSGGLPLGKEHEASGITSTETIQEISSEVEIPKEVERVGVTKIRETIEIPPDVKKLGVTPSGPTTPVATTTTLPQVVLPISDQQVVVGLHIHVANALRWLAVWCLRKLKRAHIMLKVIHGKIVRVRG